jgi:hypothetical protein
MLKGPIMFKRIDRIARYLDKGYIAYGVGDGDGKITANLVDIRAAIVEPVNDFPCYYLVCGMVDKRNIWDKRPVVYLNEGHDQSANRVFKKLLEDDVKRLCISTIYANRSNEGFFRSLWKYRSDHGISTSIHPAASKDNFEYGDSLIRESQRDKALIEPKSFKPVVSQQLDTISDIGYDQETIDYGEFYAWTALRYLMAGFALRPPADNRIPLNDLSKAFEKDTRRSGARYTTNNQSQWAV